MAGAATRTAAALRHGLLFRLNGWWPGYEWTSHPPWWGTQVHNKISIDFMRFSFRTLKHVPPCSTPHDINLILVIVHFRRPRLPGDKEFYCTIAEKAIRPLASRVPEIGRWFQSPIAEERAVATGESVPVLCLQWRLAGDFHVKGCSIFSWEDECILACADPKTHASMHNNA